MWNLKRILQHHVAVFLIVITSKLNVVNGIWCYQCGTEAIFVDQLEPIDPDRLNSILDQESCDSFEWSYSWSPFATYCGEFEVCAKTVSYKGASVVRGCQSRNDSLGRIHPVGCGVMVPTRFGPSEYERSARDEICVCDTNYCNSSSKTKCSLYFLFGLSLLSLVFII